MIGPTALTRQRILKGLNSGFLKPTKKIFHSCKQTRLSNPSSIVQLNTFCSAKYKCKLGKRLIQEYERSNPSTSSGGESSGPKVVRPKPALDRMEFVLHTTAFPTKERDELKKKFIRLGAKVVSQVSDMTMAVISTEGMLINRMKKKNINAHIIFSTEGLKKGGKQIKEAESMEIQVVPKKFLDSIENNKVDIPDLITKMSICKWGADVSCIG
jgi:hypothetical protein